MAKQKCKQRKILPIKNLKLYAKKLSFSQMKPSTVQMKWNKEFGHSDTDLEFLTKVDNTTVHDIEKTYISSFLSCVPIWYYFTNHCQQRKLLKLRSTTFSNIPMLQRSLNYTI